MERRERLRKLLADMEEEKVLEAMDALEPADQQQQQFVPSTTFYTEGTAALHAARVNVSETSPCALLHAVDCLKGVHLREHSLGCRSHACWRAARHLGAAPS
jgi:hypothetical protein